MSPRLCPCQQQVGMPKRLQFMTLPGPTLTRTDRQTGKQARQTTRQHRQANVRVSVPEADRLGVVGNHALAILVENHRLDRGAVMVVLGDERPRRPQVIEQHVTRGGADAHVQAAGGKGHRRYRVVRAAGSVRSNGGTTQRLPNALPVVSGLWRPALLRRRGNGRAVPVLIFVRHRHGDRRSRPRSSARRLAQQRTANIKQADRLSDARVVGL